MKTTEEIVRLTTEFVAYCHDFYGPEGVYPMGATIGQIAEATKTLLERGDDVAFDSIDREKVRDIMIEKFGLVFPPAPLQIQLD